MPGGGDFCFVFSTGGRSFALKSCPGGGILTEKISCPGVSPGGMVTGQIDTCIIAVRKSPCTIVQLGNRPELLCR